MIEARSVIAAVVGLVLAGTAVPLGGARAQVGPTVPIPGYLATAPSTPQCPSMTWHIQPFGAPGAGEWAGVVWFSDMSGISVARGNIGQDGKFTLVLTSVSGSGPTGTVTGARSADGKTLTANLDGPGCSKLRLLRLPSVDLTQSGMGG